MMTFHKYQGAGNDFLIADNREGLINLSPEQIASLCDRRYGIGADGLMLLENEDGYDFRMVYYNSDGSGGMMCGNGGRCIAAFAADLGISGNSEDGMRFIAADGPHIAFVTGYEGATKTIRLQMKDVAASDVYPDGIFMDTGTRHFVRFVENYDSLDVVAEGRRLRYEERFAPIGANINFVSPFCGGINVRTYEKGVEDETFACGTGIVASCIASYQNGIKPSESSEGRVLYEVQAKRDRLSVDFIPVDDGQKLAEEVWLTGPATFVAEIKSIDK